MWWTLKVLYASTLDWSPEMEWSDKLPTFFSIKALSATLLLVVMIKQACLLLFKADLQFSLYTLGDRIWQPHNIVALCRLVLHRQANLLLRAPLFISRLSPLNSAGM